MIIETFWAALGMDTPVPEKMTRMVFRCTQLCGYTHTLSVTLDPENRAIEFYIPRLPSCRMEEAGNGDIITRWSGLADYPTRCHTLEQLCQQWPTLQWPMLSQPSLFQLLVMAMAGLGPFPFGLMCVHVSTDGTTLPHLAETPSA